MANEAVLVERWSHPSDYIVADGTAIAKGAILKVTDPMTAALATNGPVAAAGIAAREKVASDGRTRLAVYQDGRFRVYASGSITAGNAVTIAPDATTYPNFVAQQLTLVSGAFAHILGFAEETASNGEQLIIKLDPQTTIAQQ